MLFLDRMAPVLTGLSLFLSCFEITRSANVPIKTTPSPVPGGLTPTQLAWAKKLRDSWVYSGDEALLTMGDADEDEPQRKKNVLARPIDTWPGDVITYKARN